MTKETQEYHDSLYAQLERMRRYNFAAGIMGFDQQTICPPAAREHQGEIAAEFRNLAFQITKEPSYREAAEYLYEHKEELDSFDAAMVTVMHRDYEKEKNITPELFGEFSLAYNRSFINWLEAKDAADFSKFAPSLKEVRDIQMKQVELRENAKALAYDNLLDDYETGMTTEILDEVFGKFKERMIPLLKKIQAGKKTIRTDFLSREVTDEQQRQISEYLLKVIGFDFNRGAFTTTEHPFTDGTCRNDVRVTTHFYPDMFASNMFSMIHEGGHALFEQFCPEENETHYLADKTMGQHESVSRFYENRLGRTRGFIHYIFPKCKEIFPQVFEDVTEEEFYEAMNVVEPSLIRTEADEFTYTFHIIIRYELEKMIMSGEAEIEDLPRLWKEKYQEYLGVTPENDKEGVLQDVHWSSGFGYFPTYALGNMYNAMYYNTMKQDLDLDQLLSDGRFDVINGWMEEHVWKMADRQSPQEWIREITGREFTPDDFLDYLEEKYTALYEIDA